MADECDNAQEMEALYLKMALKNAGRSSTHLESLHHCEECGCAIPDRRRRAVPGVRLCVSCQEESDDR